MSLSENGMSPADMRAVIGNGDNGFLGGNGAYWIIILFLFAFCGGWGNGFGGFGGGSGASNNYTLASDFATIQRQLSDGFNSIDNALDRQNSGICDLGYTQAQLINNASMNQMQSANAIQSQIASCCCDIREGISGVNYNMAMNTNNLQSGIQQGFCQTNFNNQTNTRDIIDAQNAGTRAILDAIQASKVEALNQRIAEQTQQINALQLSASQTAQNAFLLSKLQPTPIPSFPASQLYGYCGCNNGCGC